MQYTIADIKTSDHRPVYATFNLGVHIVDDSKKQKILDELSAALGGGKSARNGAGVKPRIEAKRPPPGVPDRAKKSVPEANLISFDEKASPSKGKSAFCNPCIYALTIDIQFSLLSAAPPPRPAKPSTLQSQRKPIF